MAEPACGPSLTMTERGPVQSAAVDVRLLGPDDADVLANVADDVFDRPIDPQWSRELLADKRHHLAVALDDGVVVGFTSAVHYVHPDKGPELWINEVGVAPTHQRRGIGRQLVAAILARARSLGCTEAWVATEATNESAQRLYDAAGGVADPQGFIMYVFDLTEGEDV
jgi:ribosomal protein S18 acetylase RimI-like enzyme